MNASSKMQYDIQGLNWNLGGGRAPFMGANSMRTALINIRVII